MCRRHMVAYLVLLATACDTKFVETLDQGSGSQEDLRSPDMSQPQAKCAAAKGLGGDNLLCVDFAGTSIGELTSNNWNFMSSCTEGWIIDKGALQVNSFSSFKSTCQFRLPTLSAADYAKYESLTLAVIHTPSLDAPTHAATISLGTNTSSVQPIWSFPGTRPAARERIIIEYNKSVLPNGGSGKYQPVFEIVSASGSGGPYKGWLIESIAIQGSM